MENLLTKYESLDTIRERERERERERRERFFMPQPGKAPIDVIPLGYEDDSSHGSCYSHF